jgi:RNA polymerase sigma factor (sigma-70 family)
MDFETFYRKSYKRQVSQIRRSLKFNKHLAEDIVQEAYFRAIKYSPSFDNRKSSLNTWFNKILFNVLRETQKQSRMSVEIAEDKLGDTAFVRLDFLITDEILKVTNEKHREILYLFFILGYSSTEISNILDDVSQTNITTLTSRFRDKMRAKHGRSI